MKHFRVLDCNFYAPGAHFGRSFWVAGFARVRIIVGVLVWIAASGILFHWLDKYLLTPQEDGHRVATDLLEFASAERRMVELQLNGVWPVSAGDPIYRIDGPGSIEQVGEVRRLISTDESPDSGTTIGPKAEALLYPNAPVLYDKSYVTYYTTPRSMSWVAETMLPRKKRIRIAREIVATYEAYHAEILRALKPVVVGGFLDAMRVVEEDIAGAVTRRRSELEELGSRYQDRVVAKEIVPLLRREIWPIVLRHAEPLANQIGEEMFKRVSLWRFGWRALYDKTPLPKKDLARAEWNRFINKEGLPILNRHSADFVAVQRKILEDIAANDMVRDAIRQNLTRVVDDPEFRSIVWQIFREVLVENPRLRKTLEERWSGVEARRAMQLAANRAEPCVRRIGDILLGTREDGISPEFAQVLRNQILDKDCRWLVIETPPDSMPIDDTSVQTVLRVRRGGYPDVNPFAVQLQGVHR